MTAHTCIRPGCGKTYEDNELDAYYCPSCDEIRKEKAKEIDSKFVTINQLPNSALAAYDAARTFIDPVTGQQKMRAFPSAGQIGISGFK